MSEGTFYRVPTATGTGSAHYEDRIYEVIEAGTTASSQPVYDTIIGAETTDGTAVLKAYDSFARVAFIEAVTDHRIFTVSEDLSGFADGWFDEGAVTFETGANAGRTIEVKRWTQANRRLELWAPTGLPVEVGDQLRIYPGCHKRVLEDCRDRFRLPGSLLFDKGTPGTSAASRTCPGARSRRCRRVGVDAFGAHLLDRPLRADRWRAAMPSVRSAPRQARCSAAFCSAPADRRSRGRALATWRSAPAPMAA